ncbi:MAG: PhoU domain-containing protein [candidate division WOR-3 bacterium]
MFKWFSEIFKGSGLIGDAEEIVSEMLEIAYNMFRYSMTIVIEKKTEKENIYEIDQKLNSMEIDVRKKILEHLSINPSQNITPSLVLVTLVVDIERLGDYSKNLVEVSHKYPEPLKGKYIEKIKDMELEVQKCFEDTIKIYNEQDEKLGKRVMEKLSLLIDECQDLLETLIEDESLKSREGIIYALLVRHLKRVSSHVRNVCSGIVNPFYRLGYKPDER